MVVALELPVAGEPLPAAARACGGDFFGDRSSPDHLSAEAGAAEQTRN